MSRLLKLIASVMVLSAGVGAAVAVAAPHSAQTRHASMILCPVTASAGSTVPCCGPPIATATVVPKCCPLERTCCGTPVPVNCPVMLTASSSADPSTAGQKVTISGHWTSGTGGQAIDLWQELAGAKKFTQVASTTTNSSGNYSFVRRGVMTNRQWYTTAGSDQSATIVQQVKAKVSVRVSRGRLYGRVSPNHAGEPVLIEEQSAHQGWVTVARPRLSPTSRYGAQQSACYMRVVFGGDRRNVRSMSIFNGCQY